MAESDMRSWSPESHIDHACDLAEQAENDGGSYGQVLAMVGQLHVQIAFAKSELRDD